MIDYLNTVAQIAKQRKKYFEDYMHYVQLIKKAVDLPEMEVVVFGSVLEGQHTIGSDIDVLIISDHVPLKLSERARILSKINEVLGRFHPFELHLVTRREAAWYEGRIRKYVKV